MQKLYFTFPPTFSLLVAAIIATLYFNLINVRHWKTIYQHCLQQWQLWLAIMVVIAIMWFCSMSAPGMIGAAVYNFIYFSWLGALGFFFLGFSNKRANWRAIITGLALVILIIILLIDYLDTHTYSSTQMLGVALSLIGGTTSFIYFKQSQLLTSRTNLSATQILATRYYLTIIAMIAITPFHGVSHNLTIYNSFLLVLLAIISLIAPLYCIQKALDHVSPERNAIYVSLTPIVTAFLQEAVFHNVNFDYLIIYILYAIVMGVSYAKRGQNKETL